MTHKPKRTPDGFLLNEPTVSTPGGIRRKSVLISRKTFPAIARREQLNRLLLFHDLEKPTKNFDHLSEKDLGHLRQIALEGAIPTSYQRFATMLSYY